LHYISFTFKQSLTALSNACSSAFNLFLCLLFTSTYSHRCKNYFEAKRRLCWLFLFFVSAVGARTHTHQALTKNKNNQHRSDTVLVVFVSLRYYFSIVTELCNTYTLPSTYFLLNSYLILPSLLHFAVLAPNKYSLLIYYLMFIKHELCVELTYALHQLYFETVSLPFQAPVHRLLIYSFNPNNTSTYSHRSHLIV